MTERGAARLEREARSLRIGPSKLEWDGDSLVVTIDEVTVPWPSRVRGTVRVTPAGRHATSYPLDAAGRHHWQPMAPCADVEVDLARPANRWRGTGYLDSNRGSAPLEADFASWHWARARAADGRVSVLYDVDRRDGSALALALGYRRGSTAAEMLAPPPAVPLAPSAWRIARAARSDPGVAPTVMLTLEDGPFYARSLIGARLDGHAVTAVHESLDLDRFASPWVQAMLPFRMPRRA